MDIGKFFGSLIRYKTYWVTFTIWIILKGLVLSLDGSWGIHLILIVGAIIVHTIVVLSIDSNYVDNERWNNRNASLSFTSIIIIPIIMIGLSYWTIIKPIYIDYNTSPRIDIVLPLENVQLYYNDANVMFILFIEGQKQPLVLSKSGYPDTYNRLKADFLDNKIQVVKKETKGWTDDNSSIQYHLDDNTFD